MLKFKQKQQELLEKFPKRWSASGKTDTMIEEAKNLMLVLDAKNSVSSIRKLPELGYPKQIWNIMCFNHENTFNQFSSM